MTRADLHRLIDELPDNAVEGAAALLQQLACGEIDPGQAWVWAPQWQAQLQASLDDLAGNHTRTYGSSQAFIDSLP